MTRLCKGGPRSKFCMLSRDMTAIFCSGEPTLESPTAKLDLVMPEKDAT